MSEYSCHKKIILTPLEKSLNRGQIRSSLMGFTLIAIGVLTVFGASSLLFGDEPVTQASGNRSYIFCKDTYGKDKGTVRARCPLFRRVRRCKKKEGRLSMMQKEARRDAKEGMDLKQAGDLEGARVAYQKAVLKDPVYAQAHNELGLIYETLGMLALAQQSFLKSIEANKCYLSAYSNLVSLYEKKGDLANAARYWEKMIQLEAKEFN